MTIFIMVTILTLTTFIANDNDNDNGYDIDNDEDIYHFVTIRKVGQIDIVAYMKGFLNKFLKTDPCAR